MVLPLVLSLLQARQAGPGSVPTACCSLPRSDELAPSHGGDLQGPSEKQRVAGPEHAPGDPGFIGLQELGSSQCVSLGALSPELGPGE